MTMTPTQAFIGLGSNLDDPVAHVSQALEQLADAPALHRLQASGLYRSSPMGPSDQPDYINAVARIETKLSAEALLYFLQAIENQHGRVREGVRWGPRTLDLDILLFGDLCIQSDRLTIPHPGIGLRNFVLYPMREIDPTLNIPGLGLIDDLIAQLDQSAPCRLTQTNQAS